MTAESFTRAARRVRWSLVLAWLALDQAGAFGQAKLTPGGAAIGGPPSGNGGNLGAAGGFGGSSSPGAGFGGNLGMLGSPSQRFKFSFEPNTPLNNVLPTPPMLAKPPSPWLVKDLNRVPEVFFQKRLEVKSLSPKELEEKTAAEKETLAKESSEAQGRARAHIAHTLAKINHLNQKEPDYFMKALMESRADLAGLPFILGDACRMKKSVSRQFLLEVAQLRPFGPPGGGFQGGGFSGCSQVQSQPTADEISQAKVAAWMQVLAPEPPAKRKELVKKLTAIKHADATRALAKLAVFSQEKEIRDAALLALKARPHEDYDAVLLHGLRYPWPEFAKHATEAMFRLERRDLLPTLIAFLDEPDPRAPAEQEINGRTVPVVRELVRLNHHHNCITCHAPATSDPEFNKSGFTSDFMTGQVTVPGQSLSPPPGGFGYFGGFQSFPDLFVRVDVTYLRQDFSLLQKVEKGMTGAPVERFDFLVRAREVPPQDVKSYEAWKAKQGLKYLSPNHQAALAALRKLTGCNAEPTSAAWRAALEAKEDAALQKPAYARFLRDTR
jgi:hypothetical protein